MAAVIEDTRDALVVTVESLPRSRYFVRAVMVSLYVVMALSMLAAWSRTHYRAPLPPFFLLMMSIVVAPLWLRARVAFERLTLSSSGLILETTMWPRRARRFSLPSVQAARWAPSLLAPLLDPRVLVLDVGGRARRFGADLDEDEGRRIVTLIEERLQRLRIGPYR